MKNRLKCMVMVLICCSFMSACNRTPDCPPIRDYTEFMVMKDGKPQTEMFPKAVAKGFLHLMSSDSKSPYNVFGARPFDNNMFLSYDYKTQRIDTIFRSDTAVRVFYPITKEEYYIGGVFGALRKVTPDTVYAWNISKQIPLPPYGSDYFTRWTAREPLIIDKGKEIFMTTIAPYHNWYLTNEKEGARTHLENPKFLFFTIEGDSLRKLKYDGYFPLNYLKNNFASSGLYSDYCAETGDMVFYNEFFDSVSVVNLFNDSPARTYYMGSRFYEKPRDLSYEESMNFARELEYRMSTNCYGTVQYDPYRKVYLRELSIPSKLQDETALTKSNMRDMVIIVSDLDFNVKYEVFFPSSTYQSAFNLMIVEEGVYLMEKTKENKESYEATLFSFP